MSTEGPQHAPVPNSGPPYLAPIAIFGLTPNNSKDVPASAVLLAIFGILGILHMRLFKVNKARHHFFVFNAVTFGFCMSRIVTFAMRITWAKHPRNVDVAIAAQVFIAAGVVLLYVINLIFAQRILASLHPVTGQRVRLLFKSYYFLIVAVLIMVIVSTVVSFYTRNPDTLKSTGDIRKFGGVWFAVFSFMPIPVTLAAILIPSSSSNPPTPLGTGSVTAKAAVVISAAVLLCLGSAFRTGISFLAPRPITNPAWYHKRPAFYVFLPTLEILVVILYLVGRIDKRFYIEGEKDRKAREASEPVGSDTSTGEKAAV